MNLNLSQNIVDGLKNLGVALNVEHSKKLIANVVKLAIHQDANIPSNPEIYASDPELAKQSEFAVVSLFLLASKYGLDHQKLGNLLEQHGVSTIITEELMRVYEITSKDLTVNNLKVGNCFPHITDVDWKLLYHVKSSTTDESSQELLYKISLGNFNEKSAKHETITEFVCDTEELQLFVNQLKEIERHCHKLSLEK